MLLAIMLFEINLDKKARRRVQLQLVPNNRSLGKSQKSNKNESIRVRVKQIINETQK